MANPRQEECLTCACEFSPTLAAWHRPECGHRFCSVCMGRLVDPATDTLKCAYPWCARVALEGRPALALCTEDLGFSEWAVNTVAEAEGVDGTRLALRLLQAIITDLTARGDVSEALAVQVDAVKKQVDDAAKRSHVLGVYGDTGSGKTTLLNALLSEEFLTCSDTRACTTAPTFLQYGDSLAYHVAVHTLTTLQWREQVEAMLVPAFPVPAEEVEEEGAEDNAAPARRSPRPPPGPDHADFVPLRQVYGRARLSAILDAALQSDPAAPLIARVSVLADELFSSHPAVRHPLVPEDRMTLQDLLEQGVWECDLNSIGLVQTLLQDKLSGDQAHEHLVTKIAITHKWPILMRGLVLLDLPGVRDADRGRGNTAIAGLKHCDSVLVTGSMNRFLSSETVKNYVDEAVVQQEAEIHLQTNLYHARFFVATGADNNVVKSAVQLKGYMTQPDVLFRDAGVNRVEYTGLCERAPARGRDLKTLRNLYARLQQWDVQGSAHQNLGLHRLFGGRGEHQQHAVSVHAVSAIEYLALAGGGDADDCLFADAEQTGLPALQALVERLPDKHMLVLAIAAARSLFLLVPCYLSNSSGILNGAAPDGADAAEWALLEARLAAAQLSLQAELGRVCQAFLEGALAEGLRESRALAGAWMDHAVGVHHSTMKALCRRNGVHGGANLNALLSTPLVRRIGQEWLVLFAPDDGLGAKLKAWHEGVAASVDTFVRTLPGNPQTVNNLCKSRLDAVREELNLHAERQSRGIALACEDVVRRHLTPAYLLNHTDAGKGSHRRRQGRLTNAAREPVLFDTVARMVEGKVATIVNMMSSRTQLVTGAMTNLVALGHAAPPVPGAEDPAAVELRSDRVTEWRRRIQGRIAQILGAEF